MILPQEQLITALNTVLPTSYEMLVDSDTKLPCITYLELANNSLVEGNTLGYSSVIFQIKVWGTIYKDICSYAQEIDEVLRPLGYVRRSSTDMIDKESSIMFKLMTYEGLGKENY